MADDQGEQTDSVVELSDAVVRGEDGQLYSRKTGRRVGGAVGQKWSEEKKQAMKEARAAAAAEKRAKGEPVYSSKKPSRKEARRRALEDLKPTAIKVMEEILTDRHGVRCPECDHVIEKLNAPPSQVIATAVKVIEYADGKPVQKIEQDLVQRIEYVLAEHEPAPVVPIAADSA